MNRRERIEQVLRLQALASAALRQAGVFRRALDEEATRELVEQGTAPSWKLPGLGSVVLPVSKEAAFVADPQALAWWVAVEYPDEVQEVTQVRERFVKALLGRGQRRADGSVTDPKTGQVIPGLKVRPGGVPGAIRITEDSDEVKQVYTEYGEHLLAIVDRQVAAHAAAEAVPGGRTRTQWVFREACGCPLGVLEGSQAETEDDAWVEMYGHSDAAAWRARGVTAEHMPHDRYVADVCPMMMSGYRCPHVESAAAND
jgi:hypothetical protein